MLKGVDDQCDRVAKPVEVDMVAAEPVLKFCPISRLGELVLVVYDEDVIVRHIAFGGLELVDAVTPRDRPVENDLQDPPGRAVTAGELVRVFELLENRAHNLVEFPLILRGEVGYVGTHDAATCMRVRR